MSINYTPSGWSHPTTAGPLGLASGCRSKSDTHYRDSREEDFESWGDTTGMGLRTWFESSFAQAGFPSAKGGLDSVYHLEFGEDGGHVVLDCLQADV